MGVTNSELFTVQEAEVELLTPCKLLASIERASVASVPPSFGILWTHRERGLSELRPSQGSSWGSLLFLQGCSQCH